jgi:hypothetical protein
VIQQLITHPDHVVVAVAMEIGRLDITNASINVLVPDLVTIRPSDNRGNPRAVENGTMEHTPESLYPDQRHESNFWQQTPLGFFAFTNTALVFRLEFASGQEPFPFRFQMSGAPLHGRVRSRSTSGGHRRARPTWRSASNRGRRR